MSILFILPGDINLPTGGYRYDRSILRQWDDHDIAYTLMSLDGDYPFPTQLQKDQAIEQIKAARNHDIAVVDGLAGGCHPELLEQLSKLMPVVSLIHHPLCLENGLAENQYEALKISEAEGLRHVRSIITTSQSTAVTVTDMFGYPEDGIHPVLPGVGRGPQSNPKSASTGRLLCVGSVIERKDHRTLVKALSCLKDIEWHLDCVGHFDPDDSLFQRLMADIGKHDLSHKITFHGAVEEAQLETFYQNADLFVLPSLYEGYGMAYAEAIVRGIPVIGTTGGAIIDTVPADCGVLVEPGNADQLQAAVRNLLTDHKKRLSFAENCRIAASRFTDWQTSAKKFADILRSYS